MLPTASADTTPFIESAKASLPSKSSFLPRLSILDLSSFKVVSSQIKFHPSRHNLLIATHFTAFSQIRSSCYRY